MAAQGIVQYVLVRSDLCKTLGWPVGALVAQACHASTAVIHLFYNHEDTQKYLADLDNMHKIVLAVSKCPLDLHHTVWKVTIFYDHVFLWKSYKNSVKMKQR